MGKKERNYKMNFESNQKYTTKFIYTGNNKFPESAKKVIVALKNVRIDVQSMISCVLSIDAFDEGFVIIRKK